MSRRIDIDSASGELVIHFPYDPALVDLVKTLPVRRWEGAQRVWLVPTEHVRAVVEVFAGKGFSMTRAVKEVLDAAPDRPSADELGRGPTAAMTASQLNAAVRDALRGRFPADVWIAGEISGSKARGETVYFELLERSGDGPPVARVPAVVFSAARARIAQSIREADADIELADGVHVCLRARVDLYVQTGRYQVLVEDIDPLHTLGKLAQRRERIVAELRQAGVADRNLGLPLPVLPLRVGLVTSVSSDGYSDFINELERSGFGFDVAVADVPVQGRHVEAAVVAALEAFGRPESRPDVVAIVRGGGARTDLAWFDSLAIGQALCRLPVPVLVGIGHHRDKTVLDEISRSHKTPTAAAAFLVERVAEALEQLAALDERLRAATQRRVQTQRRDLLGVARSLRREVHHRVRAERRRLSEVEERLGVGVRRRLQGASAGVERLRLRLQTSTRGVLSTERRVLGLATESFRPARFVALLRPLSRELAELAERVQRVSRRATVRERDRLDALDARVRSLDPMNVVRRGFAIVRDERGALVRSVRSVRAGDKLDIRLSDGKVVADAIDTKADS